jgi:mevalonate kinase
MSNQPITYTAYPRASLVGNPTDGLGAPALAITFKEYGAHATISPSAQLTLCEPQEETPHWQSLNHLLSYTTLMGFHGGRRLMLALITRFSNYCKNNKITLRNENFTLSWRTTIPPRLGLSGSSALIIAALRALMEFYQIVIPRDDQIRIVMNTEKVDLGIPVGPVDRIAQICNGVIYYEVISMEEATFNITQLDPSSLPPLFIAIDEKSSEGTEVFHSNLQGRFLNGDQNVIQGVQRQTELVRQAHDLLARGRGEELAPLMEENFKVRQSLCALNPRHVAMVEAARELGAVAKFSGSGGAIIGTASESELNQIIAGLKEKGYHAFRPTICEPTGQES